MLISRFHRFLTAPIAPAHRAQSIVLWLGLSLCVAVYYGSLGLLKAFRAEYVVQDDAREYVFWMQRFIDPTLLPNDLIAAYFKSITPVGYAAIYHLAAIVGIEPLEFSKVLPLFIGLITTVYGFGVCLQLFPVPLAGFISMLLLNQSLWFKDDLSSATPRAFVYPLFLAFLYYLLRHNRVAMLVVLVLQALIYPPLTFITIALWFGRLWSWERRKPRLKREQVIGFAIALGFAVVALLPYVFSTAEFAPLITRSEGLTMPELHEGGRHPFFDPNPWRFWLIGEHSGIVPPLLPPAIWIGMLLPIVMQKSRFELTKLIKPAIVLLPQLVVVSLSLFFAAHILLLKLFFPTRYTVHTFRIVLAIAAGIVLTIGLDATLRACVSIARSKSQLWTALIVLFAGFMLVFPQITKSFPATNYRPSSQTALYAFLHQQPKDTVIATLSDEANNIPTFGRRSVLLGKEYALPFHLGYYRQIRDRASDLIRAQYSQDGAVLRQIIQKYGVRFWLVDRAAFTPQYLIQNTWMRSFQPASDDALASLKQGAVPALAKLTRCSVFESGSLMLLDADCMNKASRSMFSASTLNLNASSMKLKHS